MSGCTCVARCKITASYGRKFVETIARPFAWAMAHFTISSGDLERNSAFAFEICSAVMASILHFIQKHPVAPVAETFIRIALRGKPHQYRTQLILQFCFL